MQLSSVNSYVVDLLPSVVQNPKSLVDILPKTDSISNILLDKISIENNLQKLLMQLKENSVEMDSGLGYEKYVAITPHIESLAKEITVGAKTDDEKMYRIEQWVQENITYISDTKNYGTPEYWAFPTETLAKEKGDCEDGAFLIHSLGLAAGVSSDKLRTYGGIVFDPASDQPAGHGWVGYKRDYDNQWITLDWCYWPKHSELSERKPMKSDMAYIDDLWYITQDKTVETPVANKVRYASSYQETKGNFFNVRI